jgi:hypothetical protein
MPCRAAIMPAIGASERRLNHRGPDGPEPLADTGNGPGADGGWLADVGTAFAGSSTRR